MVGIDRGSRLVVRIDVLAARKAGHRVPGEVGVVRIVHPAVVQSLRRLGLGAPIAGLLVLLLLAAPALAVRQFPGTNPGESVRINTPNDPGFDSCEPDDEDGPPTCGNAFGE